MQQLTFSIRPRETATFENYHVGNNELAIAYLKQAALNQAERFVYCFGPTGCGLTHLLEACCGLAESQQRSSVYLPLKKLIHLSTQVFEDIEALDLICIDDVQCIAGKTDWEEALFHLYNRVLQTSAVLIIAGEHSIAETPFVLSDLKSRLNACVVFQIKLLAEEEKKAALMQRAQQRGLSISEETADYLLARLPRDMHTLVEVLEKLDDASWQAQKKITIPFLKTALQIL